MLSDIEVLRVMIDELSNTEQPKRFMPVVRTISALIQLAECVAVSTDIELNRLREQAKRILEV